MINADGLVAVARHLNTSVADVAPSPEAIRRAVSTGYYALFHALLGQAADHFVGAGSGSAAYEIIYRAFDHRWVKDVLDAVDRSTIPAKYRKSLRRTGVSTEIRDFATIFVPMQELRHLADYSPSVAISQADAASLIDDVETALRSWRAAPVDEQIDLLALMLSGTR